jgi:hypothetical protein
MDVERDDLVGFALGALPADETARVAQALAADPALTRELRDIERHLRVHDRAPRLAPAPALWDSLRERLDEPALPRRSLLRRFRLPAAAAALVALALFLPRREASPRLEVLHGAVARSGTGVVFAGVGRVRTDEGIVITADAGTNLTLSSPGRLALSAGRVFLEVPPERAGFTVVAGDLVAVTTGTAFLVDFDERLVWTESGHVRCSSPGREQVAGPGEAFFASNAPPPPLPPSPRHWFRRPTLDARLLDPATLAITISNAMPDPIVIAPSKSGEPLFFASSAGHDIPLAPDDFRPLTLAPGARKTFDLRLPRPLPDREALFVSYPQGGVRVEAAR